MANTKQRSLFQWKESNEKGSH